MTTIFSTLAKPCHTAVSSDHSTGCTRLQGTAGTNINDYITIEIGKVMALIAINTH